MSPRESLWQMPDSTQCLSSYPRDAPALAQERWSWGCTCLALPRIPGTWPLSSGPKPQPPASPPPPPPLFTEDPDRSSVLPLAPALMGVFGAWGFHVAFVVLVPHQGDPSLTTLVRVSRTRRGLASGASAREGSTPFISLVPSRPEPLCVGPTAP